MRVTWLFLACLFVSVIAGPEDFTGVWKDNFGFTHYLCVTGNSSSTFRLQGAYGEFGIVQAVFRGDGETVQGKWYEAWFEYDDSCPNGEFTWHVNGQSINGQYSCSDGLDPPADWELTKVIPSDDPTPQQCLVLGDRVGGLANSQWLQQNINALDICVDGGNSFEASFDITDGSEGRGFIYGVAHEGGRILQGSYITLQTSAGPIINGGGLLTLVTGTNDTLTSYNWRAPIDRASAAAGRATHTTFRGLPESFDGQFGSCSRNRDLNLDNFITTNLSTVPVESSGAPEAMTLSSFIAFILFMLF